MRELNSRLAVLKRLLIMAWPFKRAIALSFVGMIVVALAEPALVWSTKELIDNGFKQAAWLRHWYLIPFGLAAVIAVRGFAGFAAGYLMLWAASKIMVTLQHQLYMAVLRSRAHADAGQLGASINSVVAEARTATELIERVVIKFFRNLFSVIALIITIFSIDAALGLLTLAYAPLFVALVRRLGRSYDRSASAFVAANSALATRIEDLSSRARLFAHYSSARREVALLDRYFGQVNQRYREMINAAGLMVPGTQLVLACLLVAPILLPRLPGYSFTPGQLAAFFSTAILLVPLLRDLAEVNGALLRGGVAAQAVFDVLDRPQERTDGCAVPCDTQRYAIVFDDVCVHLPSRATASLAGIKFSVETGEALAVRGPCGSGKSTLINLIPRLLYPTQGRVALNGADIADLDLHQLRALITVVDQEPVLVHGSVVDNVCYGDAAPDLRRFWRAINAAQLGGVVDALPEGKDTVIDAARTNLSGGERQLMSLARAFYRAAPILILDEPTSSLDPGVKLAVLDELRRFGRGRLVLLASHCPATLALADRYLSLHDGSIVDAGPTFPPARAAA